MYYVIVVALMFVLPVASIGLGGGFTHPDTLWPLIGKWFVFWSVGIRLALAGTRQIAQPRYTAETILGIKGDDALVVVRELGFANLSLGIVGIASLHFTSWVQAGALAGAVFYGLAGINHMLRGERNTHGNVAMASDLLIAAVLLGYTTWAALRVSGGV